MRWWRTRPWSSWRRRQGPGAGGGPGGPAEAAGVGRDGDLSAAVGRGAGLGERGPGRAAGGRVRAELAVAPVADPGDERAVGGLRQAGAGAEDRMRRHAG